MDRSLLSAVSGIDANQTWLDVIGNNIANANTTGFKQDNVSFGDLLSQQIQGATAPNPPSLGGVDTVSVGTGVKTVAVTPDESQGTLQQTNNPADVYINGEGYLIAQSQGTPLYTRDGTLMFDSNGNMVTPTGAFVQGWEAQNGVINTALPSGNLTIPVGLAIPPRATANVNVGGNLPGDSINTTQETATVNVYDTQGNEVSVLMTFTRNTAQDHGASGYAGSPSTQAWDLTATINNGATPILASTELDFNLSGVLLGANNGTKLPNATGAEAGVLQLPTTASNPDYLGGILNSFNLNLPATAAGQNDLTQFAGSATAQALSQDGYATGTLASLSIGDTGIITGAFTNGQSLQLGQLAMANFANPQGLQAVGNNMWEGTANSGIALVGTAGSGGRGTLTGGALEASNVDMSTQLTNMVVAQTSYQANTRVVTTDATVLNSLIQMA